MVEPFPFEMENGTEPFGTGGFFLGKTGRKSVRDCKIHKARVKVHFLVGQQLKAHSRVGRIYPKKSIIMIPSPDFILIFSLIKICCTVFRKNAHKSC